jgi:hypothetical protein
MIYPQEISAGESRWGFESLLIEGIDALQSGQTNPPPVPVVARILSSSDILIKVYELRRRIVYSHRRWGHYHKTRRNCWTPLSHLQGDLRQFMYDYNAGTHQEIFGEEIEPAQFKYRKASQKNSPT